MDDYRAVFGRHIRTLRRLQGVTQEELAYRAGIHAVYLSGIERGVRNPSLKNIRAIARALNARTAELFAFEDEEDEPQDIG